MTEQSCDYCGETIEGEPVRRGSRVYCSEACAFEAGRSKDCSGRTDSPISPSIVKPADQRDKESRSEPRGGRYQ